MIVYTRDQYHKFLTGQHYQTSEQADSGRTKHKWRTLLQTMDRPKKMIHHGEIGGTSVTGQIEAATFTIDLVHQKNKEKWRFGYSLGGESLVHHQLSFIDHMNVIQKN